MYRKLALHAGLEELELGVIGRRGRQEMMYPSHGTQDQCLEMTLDNRLDEQEGLKKLTKLDESLMDGRIGVLENWPKLNRIAGLLGAISTPCQERVNGFARSPSGWIKSCDG